MRAESNAPRRRSRVAEFGRTPESRGPQRERLRALLRAATDPLTARELATQLTGDPRPPAPVVDYVRADLHHLLNLGFAVSLGSLPARYRASPRAKRAGR